MCCQGDTQKKIPGAATPGIFCAFVGLLSVKPLAYVITNYTCCDRNNERYNISQGFHLPPVGGADLNIISSILLVVKNNKKFIIMI